jgi:energy-coupling factor transport system permease protein
MCLSLRWDVFRLARAGLILSLAFIAGGFLSWFVKFQSPHCLEIMAAMRAVLRLIILAASGLLFMLTTPVSRFIRSLEKMRLPFSLIFVLTMAIRFFPHCLREMELIRDNARSRGVWGRALILHPYRSCRALLFPLLVRSLKKADALALAATIRGFGGPAQRSSIRQTGFQKGDFLFLLSLLILSLSLLWVDQWLQVRGGITG